MSEIPDLASIPDRLKDWALALGFADLAIAPCELDQDLSRLRDWLAQGHHAGMAYMARDPELRTQPARLHPGTVTVISVRMDYATEPVAESMPRLDAPDMAYIARYALGRDYHKVIRGRLKTLCRKLEEQIGPFGYRAFADSAPILEKALGRNAGLGWIGKNTLLMNRQAGSMFFLGEIFTDLPLTATQRQEAVSHCGSCSACIDICPTQAILGPGRLDAGKCISYLTIEHRGTIPEELRAPIGNRIFGCDDCQLVCPWNRYASISPVADFAPRHGLDGADLVALFAWDEDEYLRRTEGMALRRAGYRGWLRNIAVALGNQPYSARVVEALRSRAEDSDPLVGEHVHWALAQQHAKR